MVYRLANVWPGSRIGARRPSAARADVESVPVSAKRVLSGSPDETDRGTGVWHTAHRSIVGDVAAPQYVQSIGGVLGRVEDYPTVKTPNKEQYTCGATLT